MTQPYHSTGPAAEDATRLAMLALHRALASCEEQITAAAETQLQNALYYLRQSPAAGGAVARLEAIALDLRVMVQARREGRPNLYASRLARVRRAVLH